ncbi:G2/mitotic-specific cyclin-B3 isoform X1 [Oncorhynchus tshawytscha]|uniref:G2/mitotic-specific cyclin-B3 isoform X1 n=1 Tax=Oncorhynchus tshawytscha TaxID=74940 RepID=UPI000D0A2ACB|nr:G2/mitotic-specific cyclin-B3 isoform X1 [Oncorhynchus tshawytscha]
MPFPRGKKPSVTAGSKIPKLRGKGIENQEEGPQVKRSSSPPQGAPKKRTAFVDLTNAHKVHISLPGTKKNSLKKTQKKKATSTVLDKNEANLKKSESISSESQEEEKQRGEEETPVEQLVVVEAVPPRELPPHLQGPQIPEEFDIDSQHQDDPTLTAQYAKEIFDYLKAREEKFILSDYMSIQPSLNAGMRAILVDWLVEVQENFELNHETLYLAVKVTDHFLSAAPVNRENLQLIGSTALLIASKFEERCPPCVDDFLYVCDDAYKREEVIAMETSILQALGFDINIPVPYRFLRRYAKCVSASMETLTLARYVCELSLQEMDLVPERGSLLASACLLLALVTKELGGWSPILVFHSGYGVSELVPVVRRLHSMLTSPPDDKLLAIRSKYSHKVFFEVATTPMVDLDTLERALK